jgi:hypothetical protein
MVVLVMSGPLDVDLKSVSRPGQRCTFRTRCVATVSSTDWVRNSVRYVVAPRRRAANRARAEPVKVVKVVVIADLLSVGRPVSPGWLHGGRERFRASYR